MNETVQRHPNTLLATTSSSAQVRSCRKHVPPTCQTCQGRSVKSPGPRTCALSLSPTTKGKMIDPLPIGPFMALVTEVVLIVVISSSDLIHCEINDEDKKIGLWTSRNDSGTTHVLAQTTHERILGVVVHTMLVSLRPVLMLWFIASSSVLLGYFFMWAIRRCLCAQSFQWMATAVGMAFVSEGKSNKNIN